MRPIVVTGCQRSGTAYVSALFTASGWWCSHERFFSEARQYQVRPDTIESSHCVAPFLTQLPDDALVVHLVRNPLDVLSTLLANRKFVGKAPDSVKFARKQAPQIHVKKDSELQRVMRYWHGWNNLIEQSGRVTHRWQVEHITADDIANLLALSNRGGVMSYVRHALNITPKRVNASARDVELLGWDDLPNGPLARRVQGMAYDYGYMHRGYPQDRSAL